MAVGAAIQDRPVNISKMSIEDERFLARGGMRAQCCMQAGVQRTGRARGGRMAWADELANTATRGHATGRGAAGGHPTLLGSSLARAHWTPARESGRQWQACSRVSAVHSMLGGADKQWTVVRSARPRRLRQGFMVAIRPFPPTLFRGLLVAVALTRSYSTNERPSRPGGNRSYDALNTTLSPAHDISLVHPPPRRELSREGTMYSHPDFRDPAHRMGRRKNTGSENSAR